MTVSGNFFKGIFFFILCIMILRSVTTLFSNFSIVKNSLLKICEENIKNRKEILHYFLDKTDISRHFLRCFMKKETEIKVATLTKYKASYVHIQERSLQDKRKTKNSPHSSP